METTITVLAIILFIVVVIFISISPGIIARLIFRSTDEIKLRNWTALIPAIIYFSIQIMNGQIPRTIDSLSTGFGFSHWMISATLSLFFFGITYMFNRLLVDLGIGIVDKFRK